MVKAAVLTDDDDDMLDWGGRVVIPREFELGRGRCGERTANRHLENGGVGQSSAGSSYGCILRIAFRA